MGRKLCVKKKKENILSPSREKFRKAWELCEKYDMKLDKSIDDIDGATIMMKLALSPELGGFFKIYGILFSLGRYIFDGSESILFIFAIPHSKENKKLSELILTIMRDIEDVYDFFDYSQIKNDKEYKYLIIIKKIRKNIFI